eukprot:TRINITY_DN4920_c0_g1_i2.p1 TRINITY_DN4920_c0_g1~~TRINITY_DN4920_c0_g1_i2.p1  ORF type:complete len:331 (-),score=59.01 TRINITY_DN4920_c0_g1_i2:229-1221(-)
MSSEGNAINVTIKWNGQLIDLSLDRETATVATLRSILSEKTNVPPDKQKLLGLKVKGNPAGEDVLISQLRLKEGQKVMMMGTPVEKALAEPETTDNNDVNNDFIQVDECIAVIDRPENQKKLKNRLDTYKIKRFKEPRPGKKCLVLDVDYTMFDHRSTAEQPLELLRPFTYEFLSKCYEHYDLLIWSATSMKWIDLKMVELGITARQDFELTSYVDYDATITVDVPNKGVRNIKPLQVIWEADGYKGIYTPKNTIHIDDITRNFMFNPQNGLTIRPFRDALMNRGTDRELVPLAEYLCTIAQEYDDFSELNHERWERFLRHKRRRLEGDN